MKKSIYYSISNNGDGSASVHFFEDEKCAEVWESLQSEPFAESSIGSIEIITDGKKIEFGGYKEVQTRESLIKEMKDGEFYSADESQIEEAIKTLKKK